MGSIKNISVGSLGTGIKGISHSLGNKGGVAVNDEGKPYIKKEDLKEFIRKIMQNFTSILSYQARDLHIWKTIIVGF